MENIGNKTILEVMQSVLQEQMENKKNEQKRILDEYTHTAVYEIAHFSQLRQILTFLKDELSDCTFYISNKKIYMCLTNFSKKMQSTFQMRIAELTGIKLVEKTTIAYIKEHGKIFDPEALIARKESKNE